MSRFRRDLGDLLTHFQVRSPTSFRLGGHTYQATDGDAATAATQREGALDSRTVERLADVLYTTLHCRMSTEAWTSSMHEDWAQTRDFIAQLSKENCGDGSWQGGWGVRGVEADGSILAQRQSVTFEVPQGEWRSAEAQVGEGSAVFVRIPKEQRFLVAGFYFANGDAESSMRVQDTTRVYWHVRANGAALLVRLLTQTLNAAGVAFWFKTIASPEKYQRADAAVLYLPRESYAAVEHVISDVYGEVRPYMRRTVSAYALRLADGLAVGEDPGGERSFGQHRSEAVANALARQWRESSAADVTDAVCGEIARAGLDPDALHLNRGSHVMYRTIEEIGL